MGEAGENHSLVLELDNGIWRTEGIRLAACAETVAIMQVGGGYSTHYTL